MFEVQVSEVSITGMGFAILLVPKNKPKNESHQNKMLPVFIGPLEAHSISNVLDNIQPERPLSHDLMRTLIEEMSYTLDKVVIDDAQKGVLFSKLYLVSQIQFEKPIIIDARPSDAISLAMRFKKPIMVSDAIYTKASIDSSLLRATKQASLSEEELINYIFEEGDELDEEEKNILVDSILEDFDESPENYEIVNPQATPKKNSMKARSSKTDKFLSHKDVLKQMLKVAETSENYERAAQLKQEIDSIQD